MRKRSRRRLPSNGGVAKKGSRGATCPPVQLEKRTEILEPENKFCPRSGKERPRIGQEVTTEYEFEPAKLIIKEIVRPKYGECGKDCCPGVAVAELPPPRVAEGGAR